MLVQKGQYIKVTLYSSRFYISIYNNEYYHYYSLKWRWFVVDIYQAEKWRSKYPPLATHTEVSSCFSTRGGAGLQYETDGDACRLA